MSKWSDLFGVSAAGQQQKMLASAGAASSTLTTGTGACSGVVHHTTTGTYHVINVGVNDNTVYTGSGQVINNVDDATVQAIINGTISSNSLTVNTMSEDERKELADLREEKKRWIRQEKLRAFKELPSHLRQDIVDEAYIKNSLDKMRSVDESKFDSQQRLLDLEHKEASTYQTTYGGTFTFQPSMWMTSGQLDVDLGTNMWYKYGPIIDEFTLDELANAHSEATLEEQLT